MSRQTLAFFFTLLLLLFGPFSKSFALGVDDKPINPLEEGAFGIIAVEGLEETADENEETKDEDSSEPLIGLVETEEGLVYYYENGEKHKGWLKLEETYFFNENGVAVEGWADIAGNRYYFNLGGPLAKGWKNLDNSWYYLKANTGVMATGWQRVDDRWFYLNANGKMAEGWKYLDNSWYYLKANTGVMAIGWQRVDDRWFYLNSNGKMVEGWKNIDNSWYYLNSGSGAMATGWKKDNNKWFYLNSNGKMVEGWKNIDNSWYYLNPKTGTMAKGWQYINNKWFYLNSNGKMAEGWKYLDSSWYYLNPNSGIMKIGLLNENDVDYFMDNKGELVWYVKNDRWYVQDSYRNGSASNRIIIVSEYNQKLWVYDRGRVLFETDIITGDLSINYATHKGNFHIMSKVRNTYLANCSRYGYCYSVPVSYWMQFNSLGMIEGIHDSTRRNAFGGDIYKTDGSYGCVNVPPAVMGRLFDLSWIGMGVYVY